MIPESSSALIDLLRDHQLLDPLQIEEFDEASRATSLPPRTVAEDFIGRGWLTPYQVEEIFQGGIHNLILGNYILLDRLGGGGMGQLYKARHRLMDRIVALKLVRGEILSDPQMTLRFRREIRDLAQLSHPNIVLAYDANEADSKLFFTMEYLHGRDLAEIVDRGSALDWPRSCKYIAQATRGLYHVHQKGLIHRDVKPANLFLVEGEDLVKVLDVGLARKITPGPGTSLTSQLILGTLDFIAPEQAQDPRDVDARADLYSLGCTLYYLLVGEVPFPGGTVIQKIDRHRWEDPRPVSALKPEIPKGVEEVVARLMAKKPSDRFQDGRDLLSVIDKVAASYGVLLSRRDSPPAAPVGELAFIPIASGGLVDGSRRVRASLGRIWTVSFLGEGRFVTGSEDGGVRLWESNHGTELVNLRGHQGGVLCVSVLCGGRHLLSGGEDKTLRLWDLTTYKEILTFPGHTDCIWSVAVSPDGTEALSCGSFENTLFLWDLSSGRLKRTLRGHTGEVWSLAFLPSALQAISAGEDGAIRLWDFEHGQEMRRLESGSKVAALTLSADGRRAFSGGTDRRIRVWELETGKELLTLTGHRDNVRSLAYCASRNLLISGSNDRTVRLWDAGTGQERGCWTGHTDYVLSVAASPDGKRALSGSADGSIRIWDLP